MTISMLGIDIAKDTFQLHGADSSGKKERYRNFLIGMGHGDRNRTYAEPGWGRFLYWLPEVEDL